MGEVIRLEEQERDWVRFFAEYWDCNACGLPTRGRVYEETQTVVCHACRAPILEIDSDPRHYIAFEEDFE